VVDVPKTREFCLDSKKSDKRNDTASFKKLTQLLDPKSASSGEFCLTLSYCASEKEKEGCLVKRRGASCRHILNKTRMSIGRGRKAGRVAQPLKLLLKILMLTWDLNKV
jgi:hypothetical protein